MIKNDFELILHQFKKEITILPLSDLHIGASNCMYKEIKQTIKQILDTPNCYTVLVGDIIDNGVISGKALGVYDNEISPLKQIENAVELLKPIKDKILAVIPGNHENRSEKVININPMYMICCELGIQHLYRNSLAIVKINLGTRQNNLGVGKRQSYTILIHHGRGTSETAIKKDREFLGNFEGVDAIVTGHTHNSRVAKFTKKIIDNHNNKVLDRNTTVIVCNSFLKDAPYSIETMLSPSNNEILMFDLKLGKEKKIIVHF